MTFLKKFTLLTVLTLTLGGLIAPEFALASTPNPSHIRTIKQRMTRSFMTGKPSDEEVQRLLSLLQADGSFAGIDYESDAFNTGGQKNTHLANVTKLARAYAIDPGTYYKNREVYGAISQALKFWTDKNIKDKNWWHRIIGFPKTMMVPMMLVGDDMRRFDKELYDQCIAYLLYSWSEPKQRAQDGANGTDICKFTFAAAVLDENSTLLTEVMDKVCGLIKIAQEPLEEGIQPDYSFAQHNGCGRQLYLATYGREYVDGIIYFLEFVNKTDYWPSAEKVDIFERLLIEGLTWTWYGGEIDVNQYGRGLLRPSTAPSYLTLVQRMAALNTPLNAELRQALTVMRGQNELNGNRLFPRGDYMIHRPKGAMISTRMTSTRTVGNEAGNSEGMDNYHTGDGANYIKVRGDEYKGVYAGWNWKRIPGTTVMADTRPMPAPMWGKLGGGGSEYASGASDGRNGVCAFIYDKDSLSAHKSWFYFDNFYVALGAGITSERKDAPAVTTVNQTRLAAGVTYLNGESSSEMDGKGAEAFDRLWHYDVGYRFEQGPKPSAESYKGIYKPDYRDRKVDILWIGIDHGTAPQNGSYAYAVYPAMKREEFLKRGEDYRILSNTPQLQAVQEVASDKIMAVFYQPGELKVKGMGKIATDQPCLMIIEKRDGKTTLTIASPYCESRPMEAVNVQVNGKKGTITLQNGSGTQTL